MRHEIVEVRFAVADAGCTTALGLFNPVGSLTSKEECQWQAYLITPDGERHLYSSEVFKSHSVNISDYGTDLHTMQNQRGRELVREREYNRMVAWLGEQGYTPQPANLNGWSLTFVKSIG